MSGSGCRLASRWVGGDDEDGFAVVEMQYLPNKAHFAALQPFMNRVDWDKQCWCNGIVSARRRFSEIV